MKALAVGYWSVLALLLSSCCLQGAGERKDAGSEQDAGILGCLIGGTFYSSGSPKPLEPCLSCQPAAGTSDWTAVSCPVGKVCDEGLCKSGCLIDGGKFLLHVRDPSNPGQCCNPAFDPAGWSAWFQRTGEYPLGASTNFLLTLADVNGDGQLDIISEDKTSDPALIDVLINDHGMFSLKGSYPAVGDYPYGGTIVARDLKGDGKADLLAYSYGGDRLLLYPNLGDGSFGSAIPIPDSDWEWFPVVADLDLDGIPDLIAFDAHPDDRGEVLVRMGLADGGFDAPVFYPPPFDYVGSPWGATVGDYWGTGIPSLVFEVGGTEVVWQLQGVGDGGFLTPMPIPADVGASRTLAATGDFEGNGRLALAVQGSLPPDCLTLEILAGTTPGSFAPLATYQVTPPISNTCLYALAMADLDGDGRAEVIASFEGAWPNGTDLAILWQKPDGSLTDPIVLASGIPNGSGPMQAADLNGDGAMDLVLKSSSVVYGPGLALVYTNVCQ